MLLNFTVENCLSFKNEQEFTLLRKGKHSTQNGQDAQTKISPIAVIYGDNAAGKSNLLKCMNFSLTLCATVLRLAKASIHSLFVGQRKRKTAIDVLYRIHCQR